MSLFHSETMIYNPQLHHRRSIRLKGYDYSKAGVYFVSICVKNHECLLGKINNLQMELNVFGKIVNFKWKNIPQYFKYVELNDYIIMPNHIHGIIIINETPPSNVGAKHFESKLILNQTHIFNTGTIHYCNENQENASPLHSNCPKGTKAGSLSAIIQNFSSITTRKINKIRKTSGTRFWQRNFYERIIRDENELNRIRKYIVENPLKWLEDEYNPNNNLYK
jgi:putative transposase